MEKQKAKGFLTVSASKGHKYVQLRQSYVAKKFDDGRRTIGKKTIHSFGNIDKALENESIS